MLIENPLNSSELVFPVLECLHILGFTISVGTIALLDFRLLGLGMVRQSPSELGKDTFYWTLGGLILILFTGLLLFSSDPDNYYLNYAFLLKMVFFVSGIVFNYTIHRKVVNADAPNGGKAVACVSLLLWSMVFFGGIFIGFLNPTLDIHHI